MSPPKAKTKAKQNAKLANDIRTVARSSGRQVGSRRSRKTGGRSAHSKLLSVMPNNTRAYYNSLLNPFEYGPVRLGWGCFNETELASLVVHGTVTPGATGAAILLLTSQIGAQLVGSGGSGLLNTASPATATTAPSFASVPFSAQTAFQASADSARVISMGLRTWVLQAATSQPGTVSITDFPMPFAAFEGGSLPALTPAAYQALNQTKSAVSWAGATWTYRPIDTHSFDFLGSQGSSTQTAGSCGAIVYTGLPTGATIGFEAVIHLEFVQGLTQSIGSFKRNIMQNTVADGGMLPETTMKAFNMLPCSCPETLNGDIAALPNLGGGSMKNPDAYTQNGSNTSGALTAAISGIGGSLVGKGLKWLEEEGVEGIMERVGSLFA